MVGSVAADRAPAAQPSRLCASSAGARNCFVAAFQLFAYSRRPLHLPANDNGDAVSCDRPRSRLTRRQTSAPNLGLLARAVAGSTQTVTAAVHRHGIAVTRPWAFLMADLSRGMLVDLSNPMNAPNSLLIAVISRRLYLHRRPTSNRRWVTRRVLYRAGADNATDGSNETFDSTQVRNYDDLRMRRSASLQAAPPQFSPSSGLAEQ